MSTATVSQSSRLLTAEKTPKSKTPKKKEVLYAGATFQNSPAPSSLPIPTFTQSSPFKRNSPLDGSVNSYSSSSEMKRGFPSSPSKDYQFNQPQFNQQFTQPPINRRQSIPDEMFQMDIDHYQYPPFPVFFNQPMHFYQKQNQPLYHPPVHSQDGELDAMSQNLKNVLGLP